MSLLWIRDVIVHDDTGFLGMSPSPAHKSAVAEDECRLETAR